ncbi:MAG: PIN domain-containing protein [Thermoplasmata archaeon]|nr:MAG: PIN domain-containing protein [Thermoplasmata archaeon]
MFLDTSIIVDIFRYDEKDKNFQKIFELIKDDPLFISIFQIGEISDWSLLNRIDPIEPLKQLKKTMNIIPLSEDICLDASRIKFEMCKKGENKFSLADGVILASARSINQTLLSKDTDFIKAKDVIILR